MEKDRTILTFGDDSVSETNDFAIGIDLEPAAPAEQPPVESAYEAPAAESAYLADEAEQEPVSDDTPAAEVSTSGEVETPAAEMTVNGNKYEKAKKEPKYVTRRAFVLTLIVAMLFTSVLSSSVALLITSRVSGNGYHSKHLSESSQSAATGSKLTVAEIIDKNENSVVEIVTSGVTTGFYGQQQLTEGAGSGVIIKSDGYIVTNYHVIKGANKVQVKLHNGESYPAKIIGGDSDKDIAVIKINAKGLDEVTVGDSSTCDVGDLAVAIGNPLGQLGGTATSGIISALDRQLTIEDRTMTLIQTDAAINAGNSGGGLFNGEGNLIGIVDAKSSGTGIEGLAFAIPINTVKSDIDDIIENGGKSSSKKSSSASIGISIIDISEDNAQYYNLDGAGVYVGQVTGMNAQKAGFQEGDKIVFFEDEEVTDSSSLIEKVKKHKIGDVVTVTVSRNGQQLIIKTELEDSETASGQNN